MTLLKGKLAQRSAVALSAAALVGAIALPNTVMGQGITLNRCPANGTGGPSPLCTTQIGVPVVAPSASQSASSRRSFLPTSCPAFFSELPPTTRSHTLQFLFF